MNEVNLYYDGLLSPSCFLEAAFRLSGFAIATASDTLLLFSLSAILQRSLHATYASIEISLPVPAIVFLTNLVQYSL